MIEYNTEGATPTAGFIKSMHTGKFYELLPGIFMIKGAKNDKGFDQAYGILKGKKDLVLIDVVGEVYKEALNYLLNNGFNIKAVLITGKAVKNEASSDFQTLSEEAGDAEIYIHPDIAPEDYKTRSLSQKDELLSTFDLEPQVLPSKEGQVILYCGRHNGIIFSGDSVVGSDYGSDEFLFTRGREQQERVALQVEEFWDELDIDFDYFFSRKGKPAVEVDIRTRTTLLDRLSRGEAGLK